MCVVLRLVKKEDIVQLNNYDLEEQQLRFTGMPADAIRLAEKDPERHPVVILYQNEIAGFFVLHKGEGPKPYTDRPKSILMRTYSIRNSYQGKGIAQESLCLLPAFVRNEFPEVEQIILAVNNANTRAQHIYFKAGFTDTGRRITGRIGEQAILEFWLN